MQFSKNHSQLKEVTFAMNDLGGLPERTSFLDLLHDCPKNNLCIFDLFYNSLSEISLKASIITLVSDLRP